MSKESGSSTVNKDENPARDDKKIENTTPNGNVQDTKNEVWKKLDRKDCLTDKKLEIQKLIMRLIQHFYDIYVFQPLVLR